MARFAVALCLMGLSSTTALAGEKPIMLAVSDDDGVLLKEGDAKILYYQRAPKSLEGKWERAGYVHPLYDLDGRVLSEDFPEDHRHHRGVFWAWHQIWVGDQNAGDGWAINGLSWNVVEADGVPVLGDAVAMRAKVLWLSHRLQDQGGEPLPIVEESTTIVAHRANSNTRLIDFHISLTALVDDVRIGGSEDAKGYGGFSPRIRLPEDVRFLSRRGQLQPQTTSLEGGPWLDCVGSFGDDGKPSGLAILCHPSLPDFPQRWIIRARRSMQNAMYPGREPIELSKDKPLVLRYRLVVHRGDTAHAEIDKLQKQYEREATATLGWDEHTSTQHKHAAQARRLRGRRRNSLARASCLYRRQ
ncbi:MAG: PmoA family protein [Pirellulaceae bacterium]